MIDLQSFFSFCVHYIIVNPQVLIYFKELEYFFSTYGRDCARCLFLSSCFLLNYFHSLRSVGATDVDDRGVNDGLVKCHGKSPSDKTKDVNNLIAFLPVS